MADDAELRVGIEAEDNASADMKRVASSVSDLSDTLNELVKNAQRAARQSNVLEKSTAGIAKGSRGATAAIQEQAEAVKTLNQNLLEVARRQNGGKVFAVDSSGNTTGLTTTPVNYKAEEESLRKLSATREENNRRIRETVQANIAESKTAREVGKANQDAAAQRLRRYAVPSRASNNVYSEAIHGAREVGSSFGVIEREAANAGKAVGDMNQHLFTSRFAFNDIAQATSIAGAALIAMNAAAVGAAATYETAMAQIERTTSAGQSTMESLRADFIDLAQTIPGGFDNLAQIGELAGQLNVPTQRIGEFTSTVARFVSSTDTSVQSATEAFGRLDALLPDVEGNYEALGSSILNVGVNSVATESAIISTVTQIAAAGAAAKMTAGEVIGLAASYASLGIAPEAARGSTIRIFAEIREAVSTGGAALEEFGRIAGVSGAEFQSAFNRSGTEALNLFLAGLDNLTKNGESAELALRNLGITGVRDINALLRLSQNLDIVGANFEYAIDGFSEATALGDAFAITSGTLNSKLEILAQSFQAFLAQLGEGNLGPIKAFVDGLNGLLKVVTDMAANPVMQWVAGFTALVTVLSGAALLITALAARMAAFRAAVLMTKIQLEQMATTTTIANQRLIALRAGALNAAAGLGTLRNVAATVGKSVVGLAAVMAVASIATTVWETNFRSAKDIASDAGADFEGLRKAMIDDAEAFKAAGRESEIFKGTLTTSRSVTQGWVTDVERATGATVAQSSATQTLVQDTKELSLALGANSKVFLATQIANSKSFQSFMQNYNELTKSGAYSGFDVKGVLTQLTEGDIKGARALYEQWKVEQQAFFAYSADLAGRANFQNTIADMDAVFKQVEGSIEGAKVATEAYAAVAGASGVPVANLTGELEDNASAASTAASGMNELESAVANALSPLSTLIDWTAAAEQLFGGLAESGVNSFNVMGEAGVNNMDNLIQALVTTIAAGATMGASTTESVAALFLSLQKMGVDTANLLASVANIPGVNIGELNGYLSGTNQMSAAGQYLQNVLGSLSSSANTASTSVANTGNAAKKAGEEMKKAAVSAADFASTLRQVTDRAWDIRYGMREAADATYTMLNDMAEKADEAYKTIEKLNREISALQGDNANLAYALQVAIDYGDTERANEIRKQMAENDAAIAEKSDEAAKAQDELSRSTDGNTQSAIDNRKALLELSKSYQDQIEAYAATGASQAEVEAYSKRLYAQYKREAEALGFAADDVRKYGQGILDMGKIAKGLPKDVATTISIKGLSAAEAALKEFNTKAKESADKASSDIRTGGGRGYGITVPKPKIPKVDPVLIRAKYQPGDPTAAARAWASKLKKAMDDKLKSMRIRVLSSGGTLRFDKNGKMVEGNLGNLRFYKEGGYTGDASKHSITGMTHGKEYVVNEENTSRLGVPFLDALNSGKTPVVPVASNNANGIQVVELSAYDRALLSAVGNVTLTVGGKVLGQTVNAANFVAGKRGSN